MSSKKKKRGKHTHVAPPVNPAQKAIVTPVAQSQELPYSGVTMRLDVVRSRPVAAKPLSWRQKLRARFKR